MNGPVHTGDEKVQWEAWLERLKDGLSQAGVKLTHQRLEIFREVVASGEHPDAEAVCRGVRERLPMVSLDTVYRTLWLLVDLGLIKTLGSPRERTRFDGKVAQHHHFTCVRCGRTEDFQCEMFDGLQPAEAVTHLGRAESTQVEVRGVCRHCLESEASA